MRFRMNVEKYLLRVINIYKLLVEILVGLEGM
jgi:hypothetical protein